MDLSDRDLQVAALASAGTPKVSVCMIAYNHGAFVAQAIDSILSQRTGFAFELVIGDDCSADDTAAICEAYAARDARVRMLPRERNLGVMPNFSRTLRACTGRYVAVCEGDDYWTDPDKLSKQAAFLDANLKFAGIAHQSTVIVDGAAVRVFKEDVPPTLRTADLIGGRLFHTASIMFRRSALDLFCNAPLVLSCDRLLNFCVSFLGLIRYSDDNMCAYRLHGAGMSSRASVEQMKLDLNCIDYLQRLHPPFPRFRYMSYVYATIGLTRSARLHQRVRYLGLSFLLSFADFPSNLSFIATRLLKAAKLRLGDRQPRHRA
jgi:glycosyltransferase involved in cell wall biosynthesis